MQELREVTRLADTRLVVLEKELSKGLTSASMLEVEESRPKKRMHDLLRK